MQYSFGVEIRQFAHAVDVIDEEGLRRFRDIVERYIRDTLQIVFTSLHFDAEHKKGEKMLIPYRLAVRDVIRPQHIKDENGNYTSHIAYAYDQETELWITSGDRDTELLSQCRRYKDHWRDQENLPNYRKPLNADIRTSIIVPVRNEEERVFGVLNFETTEYLDITDIAKRELVTLSEAVAVIYRTSVQSKYQRMQTKLALELLADRANQAWPKLTKSKIFVASSWRSPPEVVECITSLLHSEYADKMEAVYWKEMSEAGNINTQLLNTIAGCRFGICYFSEQVNAAKSDYRYVDNPNVIFEAGMLHGRSDMDSPMPASWIPVREEASPPSPFDFAHERAIVVPRDQKGADQPFDAEAFKRQLRARLDALLA